MFDVSAIYCLAGHLCRGAQRSGLLTAPSRVPKVKKADAKRLERSDARSGPLRRA